MNSWSHENIDENPQTTPLSEGCGCLSWNKKVLTEINFSFKAIVGYLMVHYEKICFSQVDNILKSWYFIYKCVCVFAKKLKHYTLPQALNTKRFGKTSAIKHLHAGTIGFPIRWNKSNNINCKKKGFKLNCNICKVHIIKIKFRKSNRSSVFSPSSPF